jgi:hypothetical protein
VNDRKRAWQILHTEIARRERGVPEGDAWGHQIGNLIQNADSHFNLIVELAGFGATFAQLSARKSNRWPDDDAVVQADGIGMGVMQEPDDEGEGVA